MNNGGPSYPSAPQFDTNGEIYNRGEQGMSKLEVFAMAAMQGLLAHGVGPSAPWTEDFPHGSGVAMWAFEIAEAMLAEIERRSGR